jgi:hypothetical protein
MGINYPRHGEKEKANMAIIDFEMIVEDAKRVERAAAASGQTLSECIAAALSEVAAKPEVVNG